MNKFEKVTIDQFLTDLAATPDDEIWARECWGQIKLPERATAKSAGYDFYLPYDVAVPPNGGWVSVYSGVKCQLDDDCVLLLDIRSSMGIKRGLSLANTIGVIDGDYYNNADNEGHIIICIRNDSPAWQRLGAGDRIAQGVIVRYVTTDDDDVHSPREGGIGSTGV